MGLALLRGDRLHPTAATRGRDLTPTPPSPAQPDHDTGGRACSHCVTITPGPPSPKSRRPAQPLFDNAKPARSADVTIRSSTRSFNKTPLFNRRCHLSTHTYRSAAQRLWMTTGDP